MENQLVRLNKYVSNSGLCTRREADDYINSGRVYVNNKLVIKLGSKVSIDDEVKVDGKIIFPYDFQYLLLNKPIDFDFNISGKKNVLNLFSSLNALNLNPVQITVKQFSGLVLISNDNDFNNIISKQINSDQFINANITFKEIEVIKKVLINKLINIFHIRIEYPQ